MSENEEPESVLTPLETALAALAPRAEGLDRDRLMYLAGRASVLGVRFPEPGEGATAGLPGSAQDTAGHASRGTRQSRVGCHWRLASGVENHGQDARGTRHARWAWPAAFAAMTALAASLLVALLMQPRSQMAVEKTRIRQNSDTAAAGSRPATSPPGVEPIGAGPPDQRPDSLPWPSDALVLAPADRRLERIIAAEPSRAATGGELSGAARAPVSYRELLESLLKDAGS